MFLENEDEEGRFVLAGLYLPEGDWVFINVYDDIHKGVESFHRLVDHGYASQYALMPEDTWNAYTELYERIDEL
jgi:hypothetical protein